MRHKLLLIVLTLLFSTTQSWAQSHHFPDKAIRMVVTAGPGGNLDVIGRIFAKGLTEELGQPVIVDNRVGVAGNLGAEIVARAPADGYTIGVVAASTMTINQFLYKNMPFDTEKDFSPISLLASGPLLLEVSSSLPIKNLDELIAFAKANPGKLSFGSGGNGTLSHLTVAMLQERTGVDVMHIPYKGYMMAVPDLLAGHIQAMFETLSTALPNVKSGRVTAIALTSAQRSPALPNVPTLAESSVKDYVADAWCGIVAPAGTPADVVAKINLAISRIADRQRTRALMAAFGSEPIVGSPQEFTERMKSDRNRWRQVVPRSGIRME